MSTLSVLLMAFSISSHVMTAAGSGNPVQSELVEMAAMLPREDICNMCLDRGKVEDYNGDGVPEVYLTSGGGWHYWVCYYLDGEMRMVEGLEPWAYSSDLYSTEDGHLVLYTWPHTMGSDGFYTYRIYEWTQDGYRLAEDLWSEPDEYDWDAGKVLSCLYFSSDTAFDLHDRPDREAYAGLQITQEEYERRIKNLGNMISVFEDGLEWWISLQGNGCEDDSVLDGCYRQIQEEILNWQG